jgi:uncharacterized RDD family membrane protein YckC
MDDTDRAVRVASAVNAPAGLWPRIKAFAVDYLFLAAYLIALTGAVAGLRLTPLRRNIAAVYRNPYSAQLTTALLFDAPVMLYFALFEASHWQATPGKRRIGLQVAPVTGARLSLPRALARIALKFLPWEIAHTSLWHTPGWPSHAHPTRLNYVAYASVYALAAVYLVTLLTSQTRQPLYDRLTHTRVIHAPRSLAAGQR